MMIACSAAPILRASDEYWRTDGTTGGTWTSTFWNIGSANPTGGTGWTTGNNAVFTGATSTLTFATTSVGNVTVSAGSTVTITSGGTLTLNPLISTFDIGTGGLLTWQSQSVTANSAAGITKNGAGTLDLGALTFATNMNGGFTLNNGTVIVSGDKALGNGALTLNGGTLQSSGMRAFATTSMNIGGDFALAGTGNANWDLATTIALGASTRTVTNSTTSGSRQFRGLISGSAGAGLAFAGAGAGQIYIGNAGNSFTGPVSIIGGEVVFNDNGSFGSTTSITLDGGRLTMASMNTAGATAALTTATIGNTRNIFVGATVGTSISIQGATGVTTYNGVIADKAGSTGILVKQGSGMLSLGGQSTYSGDTNINNGTLQVTTGNDRLPTGTAVNIGQAASPNLGTFDLNSRTQQIAGLNSTSGTNATANKNTVTSAGAATLTLGGSGTYSYGVGTAGNSGVITGAISLVKSGSGTQTLGDVNTYTGPTDIQNGNLIVNNTSGSGTGSGTVTVNSGATLGGIGRLTPGANNNLAINGGTLSVGDSTLTTPAAGLLTVSTSGTGKLDFSNSSTLQFEIFSGLSSGNNTSNASTADRLKITGNVNISGSNTFQVLNSSGLANSSFQVGDIWGLVDWTALGGGTITGTFITFNLPTLSSGKIWDTSNLFVTSGALAGTIGVTAAPEPSRAVLLLAGLAALGCRRRRVR